MIDLDKCRECLNIARENYGALQECPCFKCMAMDIKPVRAIKEEDRFDLPWERPLDNTDSRSAKRMPWIVWASAGSSDRIFWTTEGRTER